MHRPLVRQIVRERGGDDLGRARRCTPGTTCSRATPGSSASRPATPRRAGWSQVAAARRRGVTIYATLLGSPDRDERNDDLAKLLDWGFSRYRAGRGRSQAGRVYAAAALGYGREPLELVAPRSLTPIVRVDRPLVRRVVAPTAVALPVHRGQALGQVRVYQRGRSSSARAARRLPLGRPAGRRRPRRLVRDAYPAPHGGAGSPDRHRHPERGDRPHADRAELPARPAPPRERRAHARRRQGDQRRARAEAPRRAGRRDRPRRRAHRHAHRRGADRARRSSTTSSASTDESRTSTAIVDPTGGTYTEINEWGPHVEPEELEMLLEKLDYLSQGAELRRLRRLAAARRRRRLLRRGDARAQPPRRARRCSTPRASRCASASQAEPFLVSPNQREAEALVGQEFHDDDDFLAGARDDRRARRAQRADHTRVRLLGAPARRRETSRFRARRAAGRPRLGRRLRRRAARRLRRRAARRAARTRRRSEPPSPRARPRRSSSAPAGSSRVRPAGCWAGSRWPSSSRSAATKAELAPRRYSARR